MPPYKLKPGNMKLKILIYSKPGIGKTALAATAQDHPNMKDVLFCNIEGGLTTIAGRGDIEVEDITGFKDLEALFWKLANKEKGYDHFNTVVIDSATELQTRNLEELVREGIKKKKDRDPDEIYQEDYGKSTTQLKRMFRWFRDLPVNVIITALPRYSYPKTAQSNPNAEPFEVSPQLTTKLGESVMGYVDMVWYMYKDDDEVRYLLTREYGPYRAKTRGMKFAEKIGAKITKPYLPEIYDTYVKSESGLLIKA